MSFAGDQSRRTSMFEGLSVMSQQDSIYEDFPPVAETPIQEGVLITQSEVIESETPIPEQFEQLDQAEMEDVQLIDSRIHVLCYNHQTNSISNILSNMTVDVVAIEATPSFLLMLTSRGSILSYLWNPSDCPLASGVSDLPVEQLSTPNLISTFQIERAIRNKRFTAIACGSSFSVALASTGEVYTWGEGKRGELGLGELEEVPQPKVIHSLSS